MNEFGWILKGKTGLKQSDIAYELQDADSCGSWATFTKAFYYQVVKNEDGSYTPFSVDCWACEYCGATVDLDHCDGFDCW